MPSLRIARIAATVVMLCVGVPAFAQRAVVPASIVSVGPAPGSVGFVASSGTTNISAQIGRWDTPYPYPATGEYAPGLQPTGYSSLAIDIDVMNRIELECLELRSEAQAEFQKHGLL